MRLVTEAGQTTTVTGKITMAIVFQGNGRLRQNSGINSTREPIRFSI